MSMSSGVTTTDNGLLISEQDYSIINGFLLLLLTPTSIFCIISNLFNIIVFLRMRLQDSITITFFALALGDLGYDLMNALVCCYVSVYIAEQFGSFQPQIDPYFLAEISAYIMQFFLQMSILFTCYLAVTRSMCVITPFRFQSYFTPTKTWVILGFLFLISVSHLSIFAVVSVERLVKEDNSTQLTVKHLDGFSELYFVLDLVRGPVITVAATVIVTSCIAVMVYKLKQSMRFRDSQQNAATVIEESREGQESNKERNKNHNHNIARLWHQKNEKAKHSTFDKEERKVKCAHTKQLRVIKQVNLVAILFVVSKLPTMGVILARYFESELRVGKKYVRLMAILYNAVMSFQLLCASANIFVYYNFNMKYRENFRSLISRKQ